MGLWAHLPERGFRTRRLARSLGRCRPPARPNLPRTLPRAHGPLRLVPPLREQPPGKHSNIGPFPLGERAFLL